MGLRNELSDRYAADLRRHISVEERLLFPVLAEGDRSRRMLVDLRPDEHRRIEETLQRTPLQIQSGPASTEEVEEELLHVLWAQNTREEAVYPLFDTHLSPDFVRSVHQAFHDTGAAGTRPTSRSDDRQESTPCPR